jgi:putative oxidoreductase
MSKGKKIALWIVSILLAAIFASAGLAKLLIIPDKVKPIFVQYGYAPWFATVIGICEVLGAIGLLVPRVAAFAAAGLSIIMIGAFFTQATHHELLQAMGPLVVLALLITVGYARLKEARGQPRE